MHLDMQESHSVLVHTTFPANHEMGCSEAVPIEVYFSPERSRLGECGIVPISRAPPSASIKGLDRKADTSPAHHAQIKLSLFVASMVGEITKKNILGVSEQA